MTEEEYDELVIELSNALEANAYLQHRVTVLEQIVIDMTKLPEKSFNDLKWAIIEEFLAGANLRYTGRKV